VRRIKTTSRAPRTAHPHHVDMFHHVRSALARHVSSPYSSLIPGFVAARALNFKLYNRLPSHSFRSSESQLRLVVFICPRNPPL